MKAIETRYKGYRFRSRLEARWAVFFDALSIVWEYEPEGFEFEDGTRYLPDFYLPDLRTYVEVKPMPPSQFRLTLSEGDGNDYASKCALLRSATCRAVVIVGTDPMNGAHWIGYDWSDSGGGESLWAFCEFLCTERGGEIVMTDDYAEYSTDECLEFPVRNQKQIKYQKQRTLAAIEKFRSARFEFGENNFMKG